MKILGLEFSSPQRSVAVIGTNKSAGLLVEHEAIESGSGTNKPFEMIESVLRQAQVEPAQVQRVAVGLGPGSYAGIRSAIAIAQGWQLAREVAVQGVSSVECLAAQAHAEGLRGGICIAIDAQRGEFYLSRYELDDGGWRELQPLELSSRDDVMACETKGDLVIGPEVQNCFPKGKPVFPRAAMLAKLAFNRTDCLPGEQLEPIYLRASTFVKAPPPRILPDS